ncbi:MAG TPA: lysophospholipid acyltransferase family protein [Planctomycetota bacterium]|nr:lysophospholipid acyltransferase family protein [Planctomycetota bacterium]
MNWLLRALFYVLFVRPFLFLVIGIVVKGKQHLNTPEKFVLLANHNSHMDTIVLMSLFKVQRLKHIHPVAAADYFCANKALNWFVTVFFNILPINRKKFTRTDNPIDKMGEVLDAGDSLILYPEGSRGEPEQMTKFNTGAGHLLEKHPNVKVIPVYMEGMGRILPKGAWYPVPFIGRVNIGEPRIYTGKARAITAQLEADILALHDEMHPELAGKAGTGAAGSTVPPAAPVQAVPAAASNPAADMPSTPAAATANESTPQNPVP